LAREAGRRVGCRAVSWFPGPRGRSGHGRDEADVGDRRAVRRLQLQWRSLELVDQGVEDGNPGERVTQVRSAAQRTVIFAVSV